MHFIGIDLAWTYKNESGICVIDDSGKILLSESNVFSDEAIVEIVKQYSYEGAIVAIDAPLIVNNHTGSRSADRAIMSEKINGRNLSVYTCNRDYMIKTYGSIRGEKLVSHIMQAVPDFVLTPNISDKSHCIIETFPTGICLGLFPDDYPIKYKIKSKIPFETTQSEMVRMVRVLKTISNLTPSLINFEDYFEVGRIMSLSKKDFKSFEDRVDALLCAYAAYWLKSKSGKVFGDALEGFIVLPINNRTESNNNRIMKNGMSKRTDSLHEMLEAIREFHILKGFEIGTESQSTMLYRMNLIIEEVGEISQCLTKGKGSLSEEHADLMILLLGNCLTMNIDIVDAFWSKLNVIMSRSGRMVGEFNRVSEWKEVNDI